MVVVFSKALIEKQEQRRAECERHERFGKYRETTVVEQDDRYFENVSGTDETPFIIV